MDNIFNYLNDLTIVELIDKLIIKNNIIIDNYNGKYYSLCGKVFLNTNSIFIQKIKNEIEKWKNEDIIEIENKNYDEYICNQDSYDFFKTKNKDEDEREYSNEYLKLIAQISRTKTLVHFCDFAQYSHIVKAAYKNGIIDELFEHKNGGITFKKALEDIKDCVSRVDFSKKHPSSYRICAKIDGLFDYYFGKNNHHINYRNYWIDYNNRLKAAKECRTITEYRTKFSTAYMYSKQYNDCFDWLERNNRSYNNEQRANLVYCYIDNEYIVPTVYVGRSYENVFRERIISHRCEQDDTVYKWFVINRNIQIPTPIVLMKNLTLKESQYWENEYEKKYKKEGYNVLNIAKTGINKSSTGGSIYKWTYYNIFREAMLYRNRARFKEFDGSAYARAMNNKWLNDFFWFEIGRFTNLIKKNTVDREECWSNERIKFFVAIFKDVNILKEYNHKCYDFLNKSKQFDKFFDSNGKVLDIIKEDKEINHILSLLKELLICIMIEQQTF